MPDDVAGHVPVGVGQVEGQLPYRPVRAGGHGGVQLACIGGGLDGGAVTAVCGMEGKDAWRTTLVQVREDRALDRSFGALAAGANLRGEGGAGIRDAIKIVSLRPWHGAHRAGP